MNIEKIIYINLKKREDRKEHIEKQLDEFCLSYERFDAFETPDCGGVGCMKSHLEVLKLAKQRDYNNILILEDDFTFLVSKEEFEEQLKKFFQLKIDYDVLFLSYNIELFKPLDNGIINKVINSTTASGYIINKNYYDTLINLYEYALPLLDETRMHWIYMNDQIWKKNQEKDNWYYFIKRIGKQMDGYSDNTNSYESYNV